MSAKKTFILHIKGPESEQDFTAPPGTTMIGREAGVGLQLAYPLVSRKHAQLECSESKLEITDLGSANGTLLNGKPMAPNTPTPLAQGDLLGIGPFEITCEVIAEEEPAAPLPPEPEKPELDIKAKEVPIKAEKPANAAKSTRAGKEAAKAEARQPVDKAPEPPQPPVPPSEPSDQEPSILPRGQLPPGLGARSLHYIQNLPGIYHTDFMFRFLALFEATELPLEWTVDHFHLFLSPGTSPDTFLPWLANWFEIMFDTTWSEAKRRVLLKEAGVIYARRGTRWALSRVLEIYLGQAPEIVEFQDARDPYTFAIKLPVRLGQVSRELLVQMIDASKPAHTNYTLEFKT